jgi:hypothetical protein
VIGETKTPAWDRWAARIASRLAGDIGARSISQIAAQVSSRTGTVIVWARGEKAPIIATHP